MVGWASQVSWWEGRLRWALEGLGVGVCFLQRPTVWVTLLIYLSRALRGAPNRVEALEAFSVSFRRLVAFDAAPSNPRAGRGLLPAGRCIFGTFGPPLLPGDLPLPDTRVRSLVPLGNTF